MKNLMQKIGKSKIGRVIAGASLLATLGTGCAYNLDIPKNESSDGKYHLYISEDKDLKRIDKSNRTYVRKYLEKGISGKEFYRGNINEKEIMYQRNVRTNSMNIINPDGTVIKYIDNELTKGDTTYHGVPDGKIDVVSINRNGKSMFYWDKSIIKRAQKNFDYFISEIKKVKEAEEQEKIKKVLNILE